MFAANAYQFTPEAGKTAYSDFNHIALFINVGADLHLGVASAEYAEVIDLLLRYGNRLALYHDEFDHPLCLAYGEVLALNDFNEDV